MERGKRLRFLVALLLTLAAAAASASAAEEAVAKRRHAYAAMMYMGTPRDYEFYVATRVMMRSLAKLNVDADLVVIASVDVPVGWVKTLQGEDGVKVVSVENLKNPYEKQSQQFNLLQTPTTTNNSSVKMQFTTITTVFFGLFAAQALACGNQGDQCDSPGATDCQCNAGNVVSCEVRDSGSGYAWRYLGGCPENPGGLQCVNGGCVVTKKRFAA